MAGEKNASTAAITVGTLSVSGIAIDLGEGSVYRVLVLNGCLGAESYHPCFNQTSQTPSLGTLLSFGGNWRDEGGSERSGGKFGEESVCFSHGCSKLLCQYSSSDSHGDCGAVCAR